MEVKKIVLDTDFLLNSLKYGVNVFDELERILDYKFEVYIVDKSLDEIKGKKEEKLALNFIKKLNIIKTEKNKNVDNLILDLVKKGKYIIATQDKDLKRKLKDNPIITIRQKKYFMVENVL